MFLLGGGERLFWILMMVNRQAIILMDSEKLRKNCNDLGGGGDLGPGD